MGLQSGDQTDGPLCYDTVAPKVTGKPTISLSNHVGPVKAAQVPVLVKWKGSDATSGINHYTVFESKDGKAYTQVGVPSSASITLNLAPGHTYRFEVTATDNASNVSSPKTGSTYTLSQVQDTGSAIAYSSGWTKQTLAGSDGGSIKEATAAGKTATLTFSGTGQVAWVSTVGATHGSASVKLDSGAKKTINTHGSSTAKAEIVDVVKAKAGSHQLVVSVLGTSGHAQVDVDAFVILTH